jgi:pimeloyl-ACP methyl ester carboxylesterase
MLQTLFLMFLVILGVFARADSVPGELREVDSHLGKIEVRVLGDITPDNIPVVCFPGKIPALVDEWVAVADPLSKHGYAVAIVHFHSNPRTSPASGISPQDVANIINEAILGKLFHAQKAVILGKSWGGYMAMAYATSHPDKVIKLALQAPASCTKERIAYLHQAHVRTFLAWAKDDPSVGYATHGMFQEEFGAELTFYSAEKGGHRVIAEYAEPILQFLQAP